MLEYPKMIYMGTIQNYEYVEAQNADHEDELRKLGYVDFAELKEKVDLPKVKSNELVETVDYSSMTSEQLRKILDEKCIRWLKRDGKERLIELLVKQPS